MKCGRLDVAVLSHLAWRSALEFGSNEVMSLSGGAD